MRFIGMPKLVRRLFPSAIWHIPTADNVLYLTFDDGPTERTPEILELLQEYDAKATFFCVGANVEKHPELALKIIHSGHTIGNHSFSHLKGWKTNTLKYISDVEKASEILPSNLFRPPYGKMRWKQYRALKEKYNIVMWSHLSYDFDAKMPEEEFYKRLFEYFKSGDIVVLHDNLKYFDKSKRMLEAILIWAQKEGVACHAITISMLKSDE